MIDVYEDRDEAIAEVLEEMRRDPEAGFLYVCHGPPRCLGGDDYGCDFCWIIDPEDQRPVDRILAEQVN